MEKSLPTIGYWYMCICGYWQHKRSVGDAKQWHNHFDRIPIRNWTFGFSKEDVFTDFKIDFKLYNYSKEERLFFIDIDSSWRREDGKPPIQIFDSNGERAVFYLSGEEERVFHLTEADYQLSDGRREGHYSSNGILDELILTDMEGRFIVLTHDKSYNLRLSQ